MCGSSSDAVKERRDQRFNISGWPAHLRAVPEVIREWFGHTSDTSGEIRFLDKPDKELFNSCTGNSLLGSQVEFSDVSRGSHQDISQLPLSFSRREMSLVQNVSLTTGSDGLNTVNGSPGTAANEGFSKLDSDNCDSVTMHLPQESSQPQSAHLTRMHECSPSLESSVFSQDRMPSRSCYVKESGDDRCISHGLGGDVQGQNIERSLVSRTKREAHTFSRTTSSETFCAFSQGSSCIGQDEQYNGNILHK